MNQRDRELTWTRLARNTVWKMNAGWWLQALAPMLVFTSLVAFCAILFFRSRFVDLNFANTGAWVAGAFAILAVTAWCVARKHFCKRDYGFVRLESRMRMHNALTAARSGIAAWPDVPMRPLDGLDWRWPRVLLPFGIMFAFLGIAFAYPFEKPEPEITLKPSEPPLWSIMENALKALEKEDVAEKEDVDEALKQLNQLREKPNEEWYTHNSMEATDNLRRALAANIQKLGADLNTAERALDAFQNYADQMNEATKSRLLDDFGKAVEGLSMGGMRANSQLREALKGIDPGQLANISAEQMQQLREKLGQCQGQCAGALGEGLCEGESDLFALIQGEGNGIPRGYGVTRGPGHAPLQLSDDETDLGTRNFEGVASEDVTRAGAGDLLDITEREHDIDETKIGVRAGGAIESTGEGGDAVWRDQLLPDEKAVLKNYFE